MTECDRDVRGSEFKRRQKEARLAKEREEKKKAKVLQATGL